MASNIEVQIKEKIEFLRPLRAGAADHDYHCSFLKSLRDLEALTGEELRHRQVLVIGCGYRYPDVALFSNQVRRVVGLDVSEVFYRDGFRALVECHRRETGSLARSLFHAVGTRSGLGRYYRRLAALGGAAIEHQKLELRSYDGLSMPFEDHTFDIVISNAVLEHVLNMAAFVRELQRVTRPGGIGYHVYHNFFSLSGSHMPRSIYEKYPWGHLLGEIEVDPSLLNRMRVDEVSAAFGRSFALEQVHRLDHSHRKFGVDKDFEAEGEERLVAPLATRLSAYRREELLTRAFLVIVRKST